MKWKKRKSEGKKWDEKKWNDKTLKWKKRKVMIRNDRKERKVNGRIRYERKEKRN